MHLKHMKCMKEEIRRVSSDRQEIRPSLKILLTTCLDAAGSPKKAFSVRNKDTRDFKTHETGSACHCCLSDQSDRYFDLPSGTESRLPSIYARSKVPISNQYTSVSDATSKYQLPQKPPPVYQQPNPPFHPAPMQEQYEYGNTLAQSRNSDLLRLHNQRVLIPANILPTHNDTLFSHIPLARLMYPQVPILLYGPMIIVEEALKPVVSDRFDRPEFLRSLSTQNGDKSPDLKCPQHILPVPVEHHKRPSLCSSSTHTPKHNEVYSESHSYCKLRSSDHSVQQKLVRKPAYANLRDP